MLSYLTVKGNANGMKMYNWLYKLVEYVKILMKNMINLNILVIEKNILLNNIQN